jgi:hypothetical protein
MRLESASELQDQDRPEDSVVQEVLTPVYIAPKTPTLQVAANPDSASTQKPTWDSMSNPDSASMEGTTQKRRHCLTQWSRVPLSLGGDEWKGLDNTFKKVTVPEGIAVVLQ